MSGLDDIVNLTITSETVAPSQQGFGVPLVVGFLAIAAPMVFEVKSTKDIPADISKHSSVYRQVSALFSQDPRKVARAHVVAYPASTSDLKQTVTITPLSTQTTARYRFTLDGPESVEVDEQVDGALADDAAKLADLCAKIAAALNGKAGIAATVEGGVSVKLVKTSVTSGERFNLVDLPSPSLMRVQDGGANLPVTDALDWAEANVEGTDWYGLLLADKQGNAIVKAAEWVAQRRKLFVAHIDADRYLAIAASLKDSGFARVIHWYSQNALYSTIDAAILSANLGVTPGKTVWSYKSLVGIKPDALTPTQESAIKAANGNAYTRIAGLSVSGQGKVAAGEWVDTVHFLDWIFARTQENVFSAIASASAAGRKIPFTDSGAETFRSVVLQVLRQGIDNDGLAEDPAPWVEIPSVANIPAAVRKGRRLPDIKFGAKLAGAILATDITGSISD